MKYIYPKNKNLDNLNIVEKKNKYVINCNSPRIYGILILLTNVTIKREYNKYVIILSDSKLIDDYDNFLNSKISNYKKIVIDNNTSYLETRICEVMNNYYQ